MGNRIDIYRGSNKTLNLTVYQSDGVTVYNLTNCTLAFYVKQKITDQTVNAIITLSATVTQATNGICQFYIVPSTTNNSPTLLDDKEYPYEIWLTDNNFTPAKSYLVVRSKFKIVVQ